MTEPSHRVSLVVYPDTPEMITRVVEAMGRTATGFALDGIESMVMVGPNDDLDDD